MRAGNAVSVLPNPYPQKIVWQNRVHRIGTRIPSVSPLGETRPRPPPPYKIKKRKPPPNQNRMRGGEARSERNSRSGGTRSQRVLERMLCRDGVRRGAYDYISHHHFLGAYYIHYLTLF